MLLLMCSGLLALTVYDEGLVRAAPRLVFVRYLGTDPYQRRTWYQRAGHRGTAMTSFVL